MRVAHKRAAGTEPVLDQSAKSRVSTDNGTHGNKNWLLPIKFFFLESYQDNEKLTNNFNNVIWDV